MMKNYRRWRRSGGVAIAAAVVAMGGAPSIAQEGESSGPRLDTIVVSAQKREETAKDVPIAVTAVSGETITDFGLSNFEDVDIPGLVVARGGMADTVSIRGVGSDTNLGFEQSVPTYIDGVYYGRARIQRFAFLDAERIEVLKGPQPTYLGKNAVAGAINITSRRPGDVFTGNLSAFYEFNNNEVGVEGGVDLPLGDRVRSRFAFKYRDLNEGWVQNLATGTGEPEIRDILGRGTVEVDLTDTLQMTVQGYIGENLDEGRNNQPFNCQASFFSSGVSDPALETCEIDYVKASLGDIPTAGSSDLFFEGPNGTFLNRLEIYGGNVSFDWDLGGYTLSSTTAYYGFENSLQADGDHGVSNFFTANFVEDFQQFSQEIRIVSPRGERLEWAAGFNYDTNINDNLQAPNINGAALITPIPGMNPSGMSFTRFRSIEEEADSWAIFGEATVHVTEDVSVTGGFRYSEVEKDASALVCSATIFTFSCLNDPAGQTGAAFTFVDSRKDTDFQPSAVLEWRPNEAINTYFSFKKGFKAGGFDHAINIVSADAFSYEPEEATAYELGAKTLFADGRASVDIAIFQNSFDNLQVSVFSGSGIDFNVANAAESRSRGVELDARFAATEWLTLGASFQYLDAVFTNYADAPCYTRQTAAQGCVPPSGGGTATQDLTGRPRPQAPEYTATLTADWNYPVGNNLEVIGGLNLFISDDFFTIADLDPLSVQDSYAKLDARIGIADIDDKWSVSFIGRNLNNELTAPWRGDCPFGVCTIALVDRPRTLAVQVTGGF